MYYAVIFLVIINLCNQNMVGQNLNQHYYPDLWWVNMDIGLGFIGFADLNTEKNFWGIGFAIQYGDLR
jgi:hypothetical protein